MPITLKEGDPAPDFSLKAADGGKMVLSSLRGQRVVLCFLPEGQELPVVLEPASRKKRHITLIGIAPGRVVGTSTNATLNMPNAPNALNTLLDDPKHEVSILYGVYGKKVVEGRTLFEIQQATFVLNEDGMITKIVPPSDIETHKAEILAALGER